MEKVLNEITKFVNQCLGFLGQQPEVKNDFLANFLGLDDSTWSNIQAVVMQLVATLILFIFVKIFLWNKVTNLLDKRQELVEQKIKEADEESKRARKLALDRDKEYQEAKAEARRLIDEAIKEGNMQKEQIIKEAKEEAKRRLDNADEEMALQIEKSKNAIKDTIVDVAFQAAEKIVKHEIDKDQYQDIVKDFIEEVSK